MTLPSFQFGRGPQSEKTSSQMSLTRSRHLMAAPGAYMAKLWRWAAESNRSRLSSITLAHILSGDTVPPISFSDFEAFLAFSDISLENLHFIVWYQDYRTRYRSMQQETVISSSREDELAHQEARDISEEYLSSIHGLQRSDPESICLSNEGQQKKEILRDEVENILTTFLVPNARKELLLSSAMRDKVIKDSRNSTDPDIFEPVYQAIYESIESVSLPRFLAYASTNINRPRQLFWYFSALPTFLLGVAIALIIIMSSSPHLVVPPQAHRAWRLFSVPCFFLSSLMWYKGYRGFCPLLWLRSSTQLRVWELESMLDDEEAQAYVSELGKTRDAVAKLAYQPPSLSYATSQTARIAPFLELDESEVNQDQKLESPSSDSPTWSSDELEDQRRRHASLGLNAQFRARRKRFNRPPIFGPDRVVEDARIRAVHLSLFWALLRFGLFWAVVSGAIVVSVPSWHVG